MSVTRSTMCWMWPMFGTLSRRTSPNTSYPFFRRSSIRYEPSWPVAPVTRADFTIGLEVRHRPLTISPFPSGSHLWRCGGDERAYLLEEHGPVEGLCLRDGSPPHRPKGRGVEFLEPGLGESIADVVTVSDQLASGHAFGS